MSNESEECKHTWYDPTGTGSNIFCRHCAEPAPASFYPGFASPGEPPMVLSVAEDAVIAERRRQVEVEGFDDKHDDAAKSNAMALAAAVYAIPDHYRYLDCEGFGGGRGSIRRMLWPWDDGWFKPGDRRRELVKAAALLIAEIEALDRANK